MGHKRPFIAVLFFLTTLLFYQNCAETSFNKSSSSSSFSQSGKIETEVYYTPEDQEVVAGGSTYFEVGVTSGGYVTYQWYKDNVKLEGETDSTIDISNAEESDAGKYSVDVFVDDDYIDRFRADLTVIPPFCEAGTTIECNVGNKTGKKTCADNELSYGSCEVDSSSTSSSPSKKSCKLPWGGKIKHGKSVKAYKNEEQMSKCSYKNRKCDDGKLSGPSNYKHKSCKAIGVWTCKDCHRLIPGMKKDTPWAWVAKYGDSCPTGKCTSNSTKSCRACAQSLGSNLPSCKDYIRVEIYCKR